VKNKNKKQKDIIAESKGNNSEHLHRRMPVPFTLPPRFRRQNRAWCLCTSILVDTCWASKCRGLQNSSKFPLSGSPKVYRTQGGQRSKLSLSSNPTIIIQKVSCVPNTPNTLVRCIGALVRWRDSEIQVVWIIISSKCNMK
jgi:hypothetical protein